MINKQNRLYSALLGIVVLVNGQVTEPVLLNVKRQWLFVLVLLNVKRQWLFALVLLNGKC